MKIAIVQDALLPALKYGGTERVIWGLGKHLAQLGHEVIFVAKRGSSCSFASILPIEDVRNVATDLPKVDMLHLHCPMNGMKQLQVPHVFTLHGNSYELNKRFPVNTVFVSRKHAERYGSTSFVHNGLDWSNYGEVDFRQPQQFFHFLGNAAWKIKNVRGAIDLVKSLPDEKLYVFGGHRLNWKMGFRFTITPKAQFFGMVDDAMKQRYLPQSKGLVFPVLWHEPFGLALIESLYYGAPVFGTPFGSLPEIVLPEFGFLSDSQSQLREAMQNWQQYNRQACHEYAVEQFNAQLMTQRYLEIYERVLDGETLNNKQPRLQTPETRLLSWRE